MSIWALLSSWAVMIYLYFGFYMLRVNHQSRLNRLFFLWALSLSEYSFCSIFLFQPQDITTWKSLSVLGWAFSDGILLHISLLLANPQKKLHKIYLTLLYGPGFIFILYGCLLHKYVVNVVPSFDVIFKVIEECYLFSYSLLSIFFVWKWGKSSTLLREKKQAKILVYFGLPTTILAFCNDVPLPFCSLLYTFPSLNHLIILGFTILLWYTVTQYRLPGLVNLIKTQDIVDQVNDWIVMVDTGAHITDFNRHVLDQLGYSASGLLGTSVFTIIHGLEPSFTHTVNEVKMIRMEGLTCIQQSGNAIPIHLQLSVIQEKQGDIVGYMLIIQDQRIICDLQSEISTRQLREEQLNYISKHDPLTNLYNRAYFEAELRRFSMETALSAGILVCDVDGLKMVNDSLGHTIGDQMLIATAHALCQAFVQEGTLFRIGGDEFAAILANASLQVMRNAYENIQNSVKHFNQENTGLHLSVSIGYSVASDEKKSISNLFKEADDFMYKAKLNHVQSARNGMIQAMTKALEARDFITEGHTDRIQQLLVKLGSYMNLSESFIANLRLLGQFHDIGKIGIPDRILFKPGPLTPDETRQMHRHSEIGYRIAKSLPDLNPVADLILSHHERWDGKGYPAKICDKAIPLECRILAVADAFDAMTNNRPYREALSLTMAMEELEQNAGTQFDPEVVRIFLELFNA